MKPDAIKQLQDLHQTANKLKYPSLPSHAMPKRKFSDATANKLMGCIIKWLELNGHWATRITTTGRMIGGGQVVDVIGRTRLMAGKWIPGTTKRGTADLHAVINGRHVSIEIKIGRDRMSDFQHKTKQHIEQSGGIYWVVRSFDQFLEKYKALIVKMTISKDIKETARTRDPALAPEES